MHLTEQQQQAIESGEAVPVTVRETECVLIRRDVYECLKPADGWAVDDWTAEEMDLLADEADETISQGEADAR